MRTCKQPIMQRRHYELIAAALKQARYATDIDEIVRCFAYALREDNSRFDKERFLRAAGYMEDKHEAR